MKQTLQNKCIVVGVTGGIAAYKSAELIRMLRRLGASVRVVMTPNAKAFITPLTLQALSGHPVHDELMDPQAEAAMGHIELARWADFVLVAPASANFLAELAHGLASNLLSTLCLATQANIAVAPAMNQNMWHAQATQHNLDILRERGIQQIGPAAGEQACGDVGLGRMSEPQAIVDVITDVFHTGALAGSRVMITAGPTQEAIDPVRFLTNHSSGKMGYAMAQAAQDAGAEVTLVSGPVTLTPPQGVTHVAVTTAMDMFDGVMSGIQDCDIFIATAAVADYRAATIAHEKIKKSPEDLTLSFVRNPDILAAVAEQANKPFCVGFAAETTDVVSSAKQKLKHKQLDVIIANQIGQPGSGFGSDMNAVTVITNKEQREFALTSKQALARQLIDYIAKEKQ